MSNAPKMLGPYQAIKCMLSMLLMNNIDQIDLDAQLLRVFLAVLEAQSVTGAARRLGLTQSAVSHALQRLRRICGEPLFVRSGRGIVATDAALQVAPRARDILLAMREFAQGRAFVLAETQFELTIAANDLQRDLLLPRLFQRLSTEALGVKLRVIPSDVPSVELLRKQMCDLVISPHPPDGSDIMQRRLLTDTYVCFYDGDTRGPPRSLAEYLSAQHASVVYPDGSQLQFDKDIQRRGLLRRIVVTAPSFAGVSAFLRGSELLATMPKQLGAHLMHGFETCRVPLDAKLHRQVTPLPMYLIWHRRRHQDEAHTWVRRHIIDIAKN
jgi:DNA-binding transcriptional LysR family regulator